MTFDPTDDGVLTPEELQLDDDLVDELGTNRYVVRAESPSRAETLPALESMPGLTDEAPALTDADPTIEQAPSRDSLEEPDPSVRRALEAAPEPHGIDVTLKTDGELAHLHATSHDVREVFREFLGWYASQLDEDLTPAQALSVLLRTTDLEA